MKTGISLVLLGSALLAGVAPAHAGLHARFDDRRYERHEDRRSYREWNRAPRGRAYGYWAQPSYERVVMVREPRVFVPLAPVVVQPPCPPRIPAVFEAVDEPRLHIRLGFDLD